MRFAFVVAIAVGGACGELAAYAQAIKVPAPAEQAIAIPNMTPEELPPDPPRVIFENGRLTIESHNSTLNDILSEVRRATEMQLEAPAECGAERVAAKLGPAPVYDVVTALLQGLKHGYLVIGAPDNPAVVRKLVIIPANKPGSASPERGARIAAAAPVMQQNKPDTSAAGVAAQPGIATTAVPVATAPQVAPTTSTAAASSATAGATTPNTQTVAMPVKSFRHKGLRGSQNIGATPEVANVHQPPAAPEIAEPPPIVEMPLPEVAEPVGPPEATDTQPQ